MEAFLEQRVEFVKSFLKTKDFSFYKENFQKAISLLEDEDPDHEDAYILALAITLYSKYTTPVYLWTDDTDFHNVDSILKGYGVIPFKMVEL